VSNHRAAAHEGKVAYQTRRAAKRVASRLRRLNLDRKLQPYPCPYCPCWYLGHPPGLATHLRNKPQPATDRRGVAA